MLPPALERTVMANSERYGGLIFGLVIRVATGLAVGAIVVWLAGRLYENIIVDRVTHMSESDLGIYKNPEMQDLLSKMPSDIEKFKTVTWPEMNKVYDDIAKKYGRR
jgi:hypothetical protein